MPRGYADYQNPVNQVAGRLVDFSGIQAAQLGLATLDGLGRLVWYDRFHEGISAWSLSHVGAAANPAIDTAISEIPPSSCKLGLTGAGFGEASLMTRALMFTTPHTFGIDFSILYNSSQTVVITTILAVISDKSYQALLVFDADTGKITLSTGHGAILYDTIPTTTVTHMWIPFKLVLDFENSRGLRLLIGMDNYSLVTQAMDPSPLVDADHVLISIEAASKAAGAVDQYIGHVYLTTDEP